MSGFFLSHGLLVVAFLTGILMLGRLLRQRRSPQSALAWIAFSILLPYLVVPLFFLLGWRKLRPKERIRVRAGPRGEAPLQRLLASYGVPGAREGNAFRLCTSGESAHEALVDLIEGAKESLAIEIFILHPDSEGRGILRRLERRAREGVAVRLLLDGFGSLTTWPWHLRRLVHAGAEVAFFHPLWRPSWWTRANLRNHRKIIVADGVRVLAGGINIAHEYLGPRPDTMRWRDLAFLLEGPAAEDYRLIFEADWSYATGRPAGAAAPRRSIEEQGDVLLQIVPSGPDFDEDALPAVILQSIFSARERIWMVTPYFVPDSEVQQALAVAARRGVEVRLIVPRVSNHVIADWARGSYLRELGNDGGSVLFFEPGMLHAKALLIDHDLAILGSANLDLRSLYLDFEVMLLVYGQGHIRPLEAWTRDLAEQSTLAKAEAGPLRELFEGAIRLLAPLL